MGVWQHLQLIEEYDSLIKRMEKGDQAEKETLKLKIEELGDYISNFAPDLLERYERLYKAKKNPLARITDHGYCDGCQIKVSLNLPTKIRKLDQVVYHDDSLLDCGRIMLPDFSHRGIRYYLTESDLQNKEILVPNQLKYILAKKQGQYVTLLDTENNRCNLLFDGERLLGLGEIFTYYRFEIGDQCIFYIIDEGNLVLRLMLPPFNILESDMQKIMKLITDNDGASMGRIIQELFVNKTRFYSYPLVKNKIEMAMRDDGRFLNLHGNWHYNAESDIPLVFPDELTRVHLYLKGRKRPIADSEVHDIFIQILLEDGFDITAIKLYFSQREYCQGDKLLIKQNNSYKIAEVLHIFPQKQKIRVAYRGTVTWNDLPAFQRGNYCSQKIDQTDTLKAILTEFEKILIEDKRLVRFNNFWLATDFLVVLKKHDLDIIYAKCMQSLGLSTKSIAKELGLEQQGIQKEIIEFGINYSLSHDSRFLSMIEDDNIYWTVKDTIVPKNSYFTLTEKAIAEGFIELQPGMKLMLVEYKTSGQIELLTYGVYRLLVFLDRKREIICGPDLKAWYGENELKPGDRVYLQLQEADNRLRIYSDYEKTQAIASKSGQIKEQLHIRNRIYALLQDKKQFLHIQQIRDHLARTTQKKIEIKSIQAVLKRDTHLFVLAGKSRELWGLKEWGYSNHYTVDPASLLLAIIEEDLVFCCLYDHGKPLTVRELASAIADFFLVKTDDVLTTQFIDSTDERILRLTDGRWGLSEWIIKWQKELANVHHQLKQIAQLEFEIATEKEKLKKISSQIAQNERSHNNLKSILNDLDKNYSHAQHEYNELESQLDDELTSLDRLQRITGLCFLVYIITVSIFLLTKINIRSAFFIISSSVFSVVLLYCAYRLVARKRRVFFYNLSRTELDNKISSLTLEKRSKEKALRELSVILEALDKQRLNRRQRISDLSGTEILQNKKTLLQRQNELTQLLGI